MTKRTWIVVALVLVLAVAAAVGATWYVVGSGDKGWATSDEKKVLAYLQSLGLTDNRAACTLEVYEQYFSTGEDWSDARDSPTLAMANATAERRCSALSG